MAKSADSSAAPTQVINKNPPQIVNAPTQIVKKPDSKRKAPAKEIKKANIMAIELDEIAEEEPSQKPMSKDEEMLFGPTQPMKTTKVGQKQNAGKSRSKEKQKQEIAFEPT